MSPAEIWSSRAEFCGRLDALIAEYADTLGPAGEALIDLDAIDADSMDGAVEARPSGWVLAAEFVEPSSIGADSGVRAWSVRIAPPWMSVAYIQGLLAVVSE
jgi:hypothetical protein